LKIRKHVFILKHKLINKPEDLTFLYLHVYSLPNVLLRTVLSEITNNDYFQMNFYKYQNKLMSMCEKMSFKCTECYQSFLTQADLQCHVYDRHHQPRDTLGLECKQQDVKREEKTTCETNGAVKNDERDGGETEKSIVKTEKQDEVNVKKERRDEKDDDNHEEDEELIDVGVNNHRDNEKSLVEIKSDTH